MTTPYSSAVWSRFVPKRHRARSLGPSYRPSTVFVLPMSMTRIVVLELSMELLEQKSYHARGQDLRLGMNSSLDLTSLPPLHPPPVIPACRRRRQLSARHSLRCPSLWP